MSARSPEPDAAWSPECMNHKEEPTRMHPAILDVRFPLGSLPIDGYRCPKCNDETILGGKLAELQATAHRLGLFGVENEERRTLLKTGNSIAVTLDPELLQAIMPGAKPGMTVKVGLQGGAIVIRPADQVRV